MYQPLYMPSVIGRPKKQPVFKTEKEAWDYIHNHYCHCGMEIDMYKLGYCESCEAEWTVDKIK